MDRYTTPTLEIEIEGADLSGATIAVTLRQGITVLTVTEFDSVTVDPTEETAEISLTLSQRQTALFSEGRPVEVQVNWLDSNGFRNSTEIGGVTFGRNLMEQVMADD